MLKALETAPAPDRTALLQWMQTGPEEPGKVEAVRALFDRNSIPALVAAEQRAFQTAAFRQLDAVGVDEARKAGIRRAVEDLFVREH